MAALHPSRASAEASEDLNDLSDDDLQSEQGQDETADHDEDGGSQEPLMEPCTFESQIYDQKEIESVLSHYSAIDQKVQVTKFLTNQKDGVNAPRGIQSLYNSSSSDCVLYAMFAFNTTFDYLFNPIPGLPFEHNSPMRILTRQIVTPLRKIGFVGAKRIVALKLALQRVGNLRSRTVVEKRPTDRFLNDLLKYGLRVEPQLKLHSTERAQTAITKVNSISVPVVHKEEDDYVTSSSLIEKWTLESAKKLDAPVKNLIVNLKRTAGPFDEPVVVLPLITISLTHCLHNVKRTCTACSANSEKPATLECLDCFDSDPNHKKLSECTYCDSCYANIHNRESERGGHRSIPIVQQNLPNNQAAKDGASLHDGDISHPYELYAVICENVTNHVVYACTDMDAEQIKEVIRDYLAPVESTSAPEQSEVASADDTTKPKNQTNAAQDTSDSSRGSSYDSTYEKEKKDTRLWVYCDPEAIVKEDVRGGYNVPQVYAVEDFQSLINHKTLDKTHDLMDAFTEKINSHHQYRILCESVALFYRPVLSQKNGH